MLRTAYQIIVDFGAFGVGLVAIGLNVYLFYRLFTNHLSHLAKDVKDTKCSVDKMGNEIVNIKERVSTIEGRLQ